VILKGQKIFGYKQPSAKISRAYNLYLLIFLMFFSPIILLVVLFRKLKFSLSNKNKILVIHTAKIGDLVCATSMISALAQCDIRNKVDVIVLKGTEEILLNNPNVGAIFSYDPILILNPLVFMAFISKLLVRFNTISFGAHPSVEGIILPTLACLPKRFGYTWGGDSRILKILQNAHTYLYHTQISDSIDECQKKLIASVGIEIKKWERAIFYDNHDKNKIENILGKLNFNLNKSNIIIAPNVGNKLKFWGHENFHNLINLIANHYDVNIILIGGNNDRIINESIIKNIEDKVINLTGELTLNMISYLCERYADLFIGQDTANMFIADSNKVPVLVIAGPSDLNIQGPVNNFKIIKKEIYCYPCNSVKATKYTCKEGHHRCLFDLSCEEVFNCFSEYFNYIELNKNYNFKISK